LNNLTQDNFVHCFSIWPPESVELPVFSTCYNHFSSCWLKIYVSLYQQLCTITYSEFPCILDTYMHLYSCKFMCKRIFSRSLFTRWLATWIKVQYDLVLYLEWLFDLHSSRSTMGGGDLLQPRYHATPSMGHTGPLGNFCQSSVRHYVLRITTKKIEIVAVHCAEICQRSQNSDDAAIDSILRLVVAWLL
jgi:hypothetical protein